MALLKTKLNYVRGKPFKLQVGRLTIYTGKQWDISSSRYGYYRVMTTLLEGYDWDVCDKTLIVKPLTVKTKSHIVSSYWKDNLENGL